jgi:hypothetical protein
MTSSILALGLLSEDCLEGVGEILVAVALVEFVLELDPVEAEGVQEALQGVHAHEHAKSEGEEDEKEEEEL